MARAKGIAEENPGGRLATKRSQYASPSISIARCIMADKLRPAGHQVRCNITPMLCTIGNGACLLHRTRWSSVPLYSFFRAFRTHTMFTNLAWASLSASMYLLVVVRLACPANA
jgi:hypothetical protein